MGKCWKPRAWCAPWRVVQGTCPTAGGTSLFCSAGCRPDCPRCGPCLKHKLAHLPGSQDTLIALRVGSNGKMVPVVTFQDAVGSVPCRSVGGIQIGHCQPLHLMAHRVLQHMGLVLLVWEAQHSQSRETDRPERPLHSLPAVSPLPNSRGAPCCSPFPGPPNPLIRVSGHTQEM